MSSRVIYTSFSSIFCTLNDNKHSMCCLIGMNDTSTSIEGPNKVIGDGLFLSTGSQIMKTLTIGDNVMIASHSLVKKSFGSNVLLAGCPAEIKKS